MIRPTKSNSHIKIIPVSSRMAEHEHEVSKVCSLALSGMLLSIVDDDIQCVAMFYVIPVIISQSISSGGNNYVL